MELFPYNGACFLRISWYNQLRLIGSLRVQFQIIPLGELTVHFNIASQWSVSNSSEVFCPNNRGVELTVWQINR